MHYTQTFKQTSTMNELINVNRSNKFSAARKKKIETNSIAIACKDAPKFEGQVYISFEFTYKTKQSDFDNIQSSKKSVLDGLVNAGVIKEDNLNHIKPLSLDVFKKADDKSTTVHIFDDREEFLSFALAQLGRYV